MLFRRYLFSLAATFAALATSACGGDPAQPPGPPGSGTPASITVQSGNNQQAASQTAVATAPSVQVKDADGKAVAGATVQFTVTAGGGTIAGASPATDASGIARITSWTLGNAGAQRLSAKVGTLGAVFFDAAITPGTEITTATVPTTGGTVAITTPGHPYLGLKLTVPVGTYTGNVELEMRVTPNAPLPAMPSGYRVSGPVLAITSSQVRGSKLMTLQVPISHAANEHVLLAFHDPVRNVTEIMPTVYRDDTLIVVVTNHLRPDLLAGPDMASAGATLRASDPVGWLMPIAYSLPMQAVGPVLTSFAERWPVLDYGLATYAGGFGPAIPVMQSLVAATDRSLAQLIEGLETPGFHADPAQIAAVIRTYQLTSNSVSAMLSEYDALAKTIISGVPRVLAPTGPGSVRSIFGKIEIDALANQAIVAALSISRKPLPVALLRDALGEPAVFATAVAGSDMSVSMIMPSAEAIAAMARQAGQGFQSIAVLPVGGQPAVPVGQVIPLPSFLVSFEAALGTVQSLLQTAAMQQGSDARHAATDQMLAATGMPAVSVETSAAVGTDFVPMLQHLITARSRTVRFRVPSFLGTSGFVIDLPNTGARIATVQGTDVALADVPALENAADLVPTDVVISPVATVGGVLRQMSATLVRVIKAPFEVTPVTSTIATQFSDFSFTASVPMPPASGYSIEWAWGDGNFSEHANLTTASHQFTLVKDYQVIARLLSSPGRALLAADTVEVSVDQEPFWKVTTFVDVDDFVDPPGTDPGQGGPLFDLWWGAESVPGSALIAITGNQLTMRVKRAGVWTDCCPPPFGGDDHVLVWPTWSQSTTDLSSGTVTGVWTDGPSFFNFNATRNGKTMTGTMTLIISDPDDETGEIEISTFRFTFAAERMK